MSKNKQHELVELEEDFDDEDDIVLDDMGIDEDEIGIDDEDYGFIIGPDGELKAVFLPDDGVSIVPKTVEKILKIFKIKDISEIEVQVSKSLH